MGEVGTRGRNVADGKCYRREKSVYVIEGRKCYREQVGQSKSQTIGTAFHCYYKGPFDTKTFWREHRFCPGGHQYVQMHMLAQ
jgi:hypothetical protein